MTHVAGRLGRESEALAAQRITAAGLRILERRYYCRLGEIDLVALDGETLVFIEVRYRTRSRFADAAASVTPHKQRRIINAARHYLMRHPAYASHAIRMDVIAVEADRGGSGTSAEIRWIRAAFDAH